MNTDLRSVHFAEVRERISGNRQAVYWALLHHGPATAKELADAMRWDKTSCRPRLTELCQCFHAIATGERRNSEHVFRALTETEAQEYHAHARALWINAEATTEQMVMQIT